MRRHVQHIHITHSCTPWEAGRILGHALQAVAVERLIAVVIVVEATFPEMIPHEEARAHFVSWSSYIVSSYKPASIHQ